MGIGLPSAIERRPNDDRQHGFGQNYETRRGKIIVPKIIEVTVSPTGETTVQTKGYSGSECQQASKWLEQALGLSTTDRKTAEYYQTQAAEQHVQH
jgi:Protein of unknown function (DUF2997)